MRESVGPDFPLMIDCYMSLTVPYTIQLARAITPFNIRWIEEFLPPGLLIFWSNSQFKDDLDGYKQVRQAVHNVQLTTGL